MTELCVYLDGGFIGTMHQAPGGNITFTYDDDYRRAPDATPLSLAMPLVRAQHKNRAVRPFLQGLLPDSIGRLEELAREYRVSAENPFALLTHIGRDAAGAVQLLPPDEESPDAARRQGEVTELSDDEFADVIADVIANRETWGRHNPSARWSLPGAQPKIALFRTEHGRWAVPTDSTPTTHILKPAVPPYSDHHLNEFMTMSAARHLGLDVADDFIFTTNRGDAVFVSTRYDRERRGTRWARLHQEDLCQAMSVPPRNTYQEDGGPSVNRIAQLFAGLPSREDRARNTEGFFDSLAFNVAALGTDAHAKNYSLLLRGERATLAPLYDLGSHAAYPSPSGASLTSAMSIDGEYRMSGIGLGHLVSAGRRLGLEAEHAHFRAEQVTGGIVEAYRAAADDARAQLGEHPFIERLVSSITEYAEQRGW